jgi:hypothetical protein
MIGHGLYGERMVAHRTRRLSDQHVASSRHNPNILPLGRSLHTLKWCRPKNPKDLCKCLAVSLWQDTCTPGGRTVSAEPRQEALSAPSAPSGPSGRSQLRLQESACKVACTTA